MMNNSGGGGMSWMEEDAVATASLETGVRGGTVRKRRADEEESEEGPISEGEENEREVLRCFFTAKAKRAAGR